MFFRSTRRIKLIAAMTVSAAVVALLVWFMIGRDQATVTPLFGNHNIDTIRQEYGDLYQASWRQDEGRGNVLMTATLFTPALIDLLDRDANRSEAENQLSRALNNTAGNQIAIFLTIDSVNGAQTDQAISDSVTLSYDDGTTTLVSWRPLIFPSRIVNTAVPTTAQAGLATFDAGETVDWSTITNLRLTSRNIGGIVERTFVWAQPGLLQLPD